LSNLSQHLTAFNNKTENNKLLVKGMYVARSPLQYILFCWFGDGFH